ncbi:hypothetical protein [Nonomuraea jabiensis]|uniref:hypothetical protein n=1 Tax=Nonomuraea jabiensis TaxID=882448 RepID=UPI003D7032A0
MMHPHVASSSAEFAAAWWVNYFVATGVDAADLGEVDLTAAVLGSGTTVLPRSAVAEGLVTQEQVSRLFTAIAERVTAALHQGRSAQLYVSHHAVDPILDDALAEAGIDLADGRLAFTLPAATMLIIRSAVFVPHAHTADSPQILWQAGPEPTGS